MASFLSHADGAAARCWERDQVEKKYNIKKIKKECYLCSSACYVRKHKHEMNISHKKVQISSAKIPVFPLL